MSPYLAGGLFIAFIAWSGGMYYAGSRNETHICAAADSAHDLKESQNTLAAQTHVTGEVQQQANISQEASHAYANDTATIDDAYSVQRSSTIPTGSLPAVRGTPSGTGPDSCNTAKSKIYKLTPQQCDQEEAKANELWNWANRQAGVK
jgi:hypothetical protein